MTENDTLTIGLGAGLGSSDPQLQIVFDDDGLIRVRTTIGLDPTVVMVLGLEQAQLIQQWLTLRLAERNAL